MPKRSTALLLAASIFVAQCLPGPASAENQMGYRLLTAQEASELPRRGGALGIAVGCGIMVLLVWRGLCSQGTEATPGFTSAAQVFDAWSGKAVYMTATTPRPAEARQPARPALRDRVLKFAELVTTPLLPVDYLDLFDPLRSGAETCLRLVHGSLRSFSHLAARSPRVRLSRVLQLPVGDLTDRVHTLDVAKHVREDLRIRP